MQPPEGAFATCSCCTGHQGYLEFIWHSPRMGSLQFGCICGLAVPIKSWEGESVSAARPMKGRLARRRPMGLVLMKKIAFDLERHESLPLVHADSQGLLGKGQSIRQIRELEPNFIG